MIRKIGILTSGGDAPGMNAAIRAVARTALYHKMEVVGIMKGYQGMVDNEMKSLTTTDMANIIQRGGTILKTARSKAFETEVGRASAYQHISAQGIEALVVIGGDGTFRGAAAFSDEYDIPVIGIPGTIDNDIAGTHYTIGFDTAVNTAIEAIDKIRDTASAHNRVFVVEVMGRKSGLIALQAGVSCGAEDILIPETATDMESIIQDINYDKRRNKYVRIIVVCEGDDFGTANDVAGRIREQFPNLDIKETVLGHIQRGGSPSHYDRWMASRFGYEAVLALLQGASKQFVGFLDGRIQLIPFENNFPKYTLNADHLKMVKILSS